MVGHGKTVVGISVTSDNLKAVSASENSIILWNLIDYTDIQRWSGSYYSFM